MLKLLIVSILMLALAFTSLRDTNILERKQTLSEYGFFTGNLARLKPAEGVIPYSVNSQLFSNYAEKLRFIKLPARTSAVYNDSSVFHFPVGTVLIKNFYYPDDFRKPDKGRVILETRLIVRLEKGWEAWPYVWNDDQTEAFYDPAGETKNISYIDKHGKKVSIPYVVPNKNQCKGCHIRDQELQPIGPSARQLNMEIVINSSKENQLKSWSELGIVSSVPGLSEVPRLAVWDDPSTGDLNSRARAYLDANCGHCHSKAGPANTSGLFLDINETHPGHLGVFKAPVAAGRGAGNLKYDIVPGQPQNSILTYRMKTNDPAIAMPEIGREQIHKEGVALIEEWIRKNPF